MRKAFLILAMLMFSAGVFLTFGYIETGNSPKDKCSDYFSDCTEGGCADMVIAQSCQMSCNTSTSEVNVRCTEPADIALTDG